MKPIKFGQPVNNQLVHQHEGQIVDPDELASENASNDNLINDVKGSAARHNRFEIDSREHSADIYTRLRDSRAELQRADIWIAIVLYLVWSSVAFVVLW